MTIEAEQQHKLDLVQEILSYRFNDQDLILSAITHPSAIEGKPVKYSYERLEFLGDAVLGAIVVHQAYVAFPEMDEGGLTRIKVSLVSGSTLSELSDHLGFKYVIIFGSSETGTGKRGMHSALENVYEAVVGALYLDGGIEVAQKFVLDTLIPKMDKRMADKPENPKSLLQEKMQAHGITPTYKLIKMEGPPHDRTFVTQVYAGYTPLAKGKGKSKKEAEVNAATASMSQFEREIAKLEKKSKKSGFKFSADMLFPGKKAEEEKTQGN
ncbi:MAG: ribonuclease III [Phoenicibacter congonensis]|uniref:Ribonuclease 3 n=1 Tax=Phoenicibacter congonensis TaxID=1944646 RepID=A0AA43RI47_9ACTN|nr:ribonuclease III [Phoenicibacter congonensis]